MQAKFFIILGVLVHLQIGLANASLTCSKCIHPKFQNRNLYLPFCLDGKTYNNLCEALCDGDDGTSAADEVTTTMNPTKGAIQ